MNTVVVSPPSSFLKTSQPPLISAACVRPLSLHHVTTTAKLIFSPGFFFFFYHQHRNADFCVAVATQSMCAQWTATLLWGQLFV